MVPANSASLEVDPEDSDLTKGEIEEDTGLKQQPRELCPALPPEEVQGTHTEHPDTPSSPWSDQEDKDDPEYPEQSDNQGEHSGCNSLTMRTPLTHLNHSMKTLKLALTQGTLTCRTSTQVAQGPWR